MARKNANTAAKPKTRSRPVKPKKNAWPGGKKPKTPVDDAVSRSSRVRSTSRGGRGR